MSRSAEVLVLISLLLSASTSTQAQPHDSDSLRHDYWDRFDNEFSDFLSRAINGFRSPEEFNAKSDSLLPDQEVFHEQSREHQKKRSHRWPDFERQDNAKFARHGIPRGASWLDERTKQPDAIVRYNRVEGLFLGTGSEKRYYWNNGKNIVHMVLAATLSRRTGGGEMLAWPVRSRSENRPSISLSLVLMPSLTLHPKMPGS